MAEQKINLKKIEIKAMKLKIVGTSPYLPEPMDMAVLERYNSIKSKKSYTKDKIPEEEKVKAKVYLTEEGEEGIPARAIFNSMIRGSSYLFEKKDGGMRNIKEGIILEGDILPITYKKKTILTHWGRTSGRKGSPRKIMRNAYHDWETEVTIIYNSNILSPEQIVNVLNWAGFHIGVGGFRKEKTGNFGSYRVDFN